MEGRRRVHTHQIENFQLRCCRKLCLLRLLGYGRYKYIYICEVMALNVALDSAVVMSCIVLYPLPLQ